MVEHRLLDIIAIFVVAETTATKFSNFTSWSISSHFSELRLIEVLDTACDKVGTYGVHVKDGMQRYAKQESDTLDALNSLR